MNSIYILSYTYYIYTYTYIYFNTWCVCVCVLFSFCGPNVNYPFSVLLLYKGKQVEPILAVRCTFHHSGDKPGGEEAGNFSYFIIMYKLDQGKTLRPIDSLKIQVIPFLCRKCAQRNRLQWAGLPCCSWGHHSCCIL